MSRFVPIFRHFCGCPYFYLAWLKALNSSGMCLHLARTNHVSVIDVTKWAIGSNETNHSTLKNKENNEIYQTNWLTNYINAKCIHNITPNGSFCNLDSRDFLLLFSNCKEGRWWHRVPMCPPMSIPSKPDKVSPSKKVYWDYDTPQSRKCIEAFAKKFEETDSKVAKKNEKWQRRMRQHPSCGWWPRRGSSPPPPMNRQESLSA